MSRRRDAAAGRWKSSQTYKQSCNVKRAVSRVTLATEAGYRCTSCCVQSWRALPFQRFHSTCAGVFVSIHKVNVGLRQYTMGRHCHRSLRAHTELCKGRFRVPKNCRRCGRAGSSSRERLREGREPVVVIVHSSRPTALLKLPPSRQWVHRCHRALVACGWGCQQEGGSA